MSLYSQVLLTYAINLEIFIQPHRLSLHPPHSANNCETLGNTALAPLTGSSESPRTLLCDTHLPLPDPIVVL